jgi:K+-sensing histidine kinase KdpD
MNVSPLDSQPDWQEIEEYWLKNARLATLGLLSSAIMHDTRNALTILSGNIQILLMKGEEVETSEIKDRLEKSLLQVERIEAQIKRAESFTRRAAGTIQTIIPDSAVENALFFVEHHIKGLPRRVVTDLRPSRKRITCDIGLLEFAIGELIQLNFAEPTDADLFISTGGNMKEWECRIEQTATAPAAIDQDSQPPSLLFAARALSRMKGNIRRCSDKNRVGWRVTVPWAAGSNRK